MSCLNDEYRIDELRYTITHAIRTMGLFRTKMESNIYNETTCDKIIERLKKDYCPLENE